MPRNINSKGLRAGPPRRKAERDAARYEAGDEAYAPGSDDEELNEAEITGEKPRAKLVLFEFGQNDPKMDSGVRLCRFGLAKSLRPQARFQGIVLSTMTQIPVSAEDREIIENSGLAGVNCSWNRLDEIPWAKLPRKPQHRILPFLVAANSVNYGRPNKLNTAEAMAAALIIVGLRSDAQQILDAFNWGEEFLRLNEEAFQVYSEAKTARDLRLAEAQLLQRFQSEAAARRNQAVDLPPEESDEEEEESDGSVDPEIPSSEVEGSPPKPTPSAERRPFAPAERVESKQSKEAKESKGEAPKDAKDAKDAKAATDQGSEVKETAETEVEVPMLRADAPPSDQKATLQALQDIASKEFLKDSGLAGLSGNKLAKLKRSEYEELWKSFVSAEGFEVDTCTRMKLLMPKNTKRKK